MWQTTKVDAVRWFREHAGQTITTKQNLFGGGVWEPGPRKLAVRGKTKFQLDNSIFEWVPNMGVLEISDSAITLSYPTDKWVSPNSPVNVTYAVADA